MLSAAANVRHRPPRQTDLLQTCSAFDWTRHRIRRGIQGRGYALHAAPRPLPWPQASSTSRAAEISLLAEAHALRRSSTRPGIGIAARS